MSLLPSSSPVCHLFKLPQDIFRVIFQYLSVKDLMKGEEAFLNNQQLLSLYRSSLEGFTLKEQIVAIHDKSQLTIAWILEYKLSIEMLEIFECEEMEMRILETFRFSLKVLKVDPKYPPNSESILCKISSLGNFPSLTSVNFSGFRSISNDTFLSFFSQNPQLEDVEISRSNQISHEFIPHLSNLCSNIKTLSLHTNKWVDDETMTLISQGFPNLTSLDISWTSIRSEETLRLFILSHPHLSFLSFSHLSLIQYSKDFLELYLINVIFPSILNSNDLDSHSLAISSLRRSFSAKTFVNRADIVNPQMFTLNILTNLYHPGCSRKTFEETMNIFDHLSRFPSMINSILESQFTSILLARMSPYDMPPYEIALDLIFRFHNYHDVFPLLLAKYQTQPSSLIQIYRKGIDNYFTLFTIDELQKLIPFVVRELPKNWDSLIILSKLFQESSTKHLIDPNEFLLSMQSIAHLPGYHHRILKCLPKFISVNQHYVQLFIQSNLLHQIMRGDTTSILLFHEVMNFIKHCFSSPDESLIDHLIESGVFQYLLSFSSRFSFMEEIRSIFNVLRTINNNKYMQYVNELELPKGFET